MVGGGIATVISLLGLAWVRELVGVVLVPFGVSTRSSGMKVTIIVVATIFMFCLDFAINTGEFTLYTLLL